MLKIRILKGDRNGEVENVTEFQEKGDTGIYITDTGATYDMAKNNVDFVLEEELEAGDLNLAEYADPDLIHTIKKQQQRGELGGRPESAQGETKINIDAKEEIPKEWEKPQPLVNVAEVDQFILGLISKSKKTKKKLSLSVDVELPTKDFKKLIDSSFDVSEEEFLKAVKSQLNIDLNQSIDAAISEFYNPTPKKPRTTKK